MKKLFNEAEKIVGGAGTVINRPTGNGYRCSPVYTPGFDIYLQPNCTENITCSDKHGRRTYGGQRVADNAACGLPDIGGGSN